MDRGRGEEVERRGCRLADMELVSDGVENRTVSVQSSESGLVTYLNRSRRPSFKTQKCIMNELGQIPERYIEKSHHVLLASIISVVGIIILRLQVTVHF